MFICSDNTTLRFILYMHLFIVYIFVNCRTARVRLQCTKILFIESFPAKELKLLIETSHKLSLFVFSFHIFTAVSF